jgi:hypothetical protein
MKKILKASASIALISGSLAWIAAIIFFIHRVYVWSKTGEWIQIIVLDFVPDSLLFWFEIPLSILPKFTSLILLREIISFLLGVAIIFIFIFIFFNSYLKRKETKELIKKRKVVANRLNKLVGNN